VNRSNNRVLSLHPLKNNNKKLIFVVLYIIEEATRRAQQMFADMVSENLVSDTPFT
jgi:hypothetical protein